MAIQKAHSSAKQRHSTYWSGAGTWP